MRTKALIFGLLLFSIIGNAQISTTRMNELKIGMRVSEILKLYGNKPAAIAEGYDIKITVKGIDYLVSIGNGYLSKNEQDVYINSISTKNKNLKTLSGLGVGSSLEDLWKAYSGKYNVLLSKSDQNMREFKIDDRDNGTLLNFKLKNEIVTEIELNSYNPEECAL